MPLPLPYVIRARDRVSDVAGEVAHATESEIAAPGESQCLRRMPVSPGPRITIWVQRQATLGAAEERIFQMWIARQGADIRRHPIANCARF